MAQAQLQRKFPVQRVRRRSIQANVRWPTCVEIRLIADSSLQYNCNKEGFNVPAYKDELAIRVGFVGNDQNDCVTCNSWLGCGFTNIGTCTNVAPSTLNPDNGGRKFTAFGYLFVQ